MNPEFPSLGSDWKPRNLQRSDSELSLHQRAYATTVKGQVEELLARYGKIDLLWFDGKPPIADGDKCITIERIRELQPGIVINPCLHGRGDFVTHMRRLTTNAVATGWTDFCNMSFL